MVTGNQEFSLGIEFSNAARQLFPRWGYLLMLATLLFNFQTANISAIIISAQSMDSMCPEPTAHCPLPTTHYPLCTQDQNPLPTLHPGTGAGPGLVPCSPPPPPLRGSLFPGMQSLEGGWAGWGLFGVRVRNPPPTPSLSPMPLQTRSSRSLASRVHS
jgi:hypothetical protein